MTGRRQGAVFSADRRYRYLLTRRIDVDPGPGGPAAGVTFIGLNPSVADERADDPTIRRCIGFARRWGAPRLSVVNLSPLVATYPADLRAAGPEPADVAAANLEHVASVTGGGEMVVAAWGVLGAVEGRDARMMGISARLGRSGGLLPCAKRGRFAAAPDVHAGCDRARPVPRIRPGPAGLRRPEGLTTGGRRGQGIVPGGCFRRGRVARIIRNGGTGAMAEAVQGGNLVAFRKEVMRIG